MSPDLCIPRQLADRSMHADERKHYLAATRLPPIQVRQCPAIQGYRLLGRRPADSWLVFRGATVARKGLARWEPRNTTGGGSLCTYGPRARVAHYLRIPGAWAARHDGARWARHRYGHRARGLPVEAVQDLVRELVS